MIEPFSVSGNLTPTFKPCLCVYSHPTHTRNRREKLNSNLYDGLNNYFAFSAQFVDETAHFVLLTFISYF